VVAVVFPSVLLLLLITYFSSVSGVPIAHRPLPGGRNFMVKIRSYISSAEVRAHWEKGTRRTRRGSAHPPCM